MLIVLAIAALLTQPSPEGLRRLSPAIDHFDRPEQKPSGYG